MEPDSAVNTKTEIVTRALPKELGVITLKAVGADPARVRAAWQGRVSVCIPGRPVAALALQQGLDGLTSYLGDTGALPLRDDCVARTVAVAESIGGGRCLN